MQQLLDAAVGAAVFALVLAGVAALAVWMWIRAMRRRARAGVERMLDRLAGDVTRRVAGGAAPGWAHHRYQRLGEDARVARTFGALQWLVVRERVLASAYGAVTAGVTRRADRRAAAGRR